MKRLTTDSVLSLNIYQIYREGLIGEGKTGYAVLYLGDRPTDVVDVSFQNDLLEVAGAKLRIRWIERNFGGKSPFFVCPGCGQQTSYLYHAGCFRCRKCLNLTYPSQNERGLDRAIRRLKKLRKQYEWEGAICSPIPQRKKRQRDRTHREYQSRYVQEIQVLSEEMKKAFSYSLDTFRIQATEEPDQS